MTATAMSAFLTRLGQIEAMSAKLRNLSVEHFDTHPDEIDWGDVGTVSAIADHVRRALDIAEEYSR